MFKLTPEDMENMRRKVEENKGKDKEYKEAQHIYEDYGDKDDMLDRKYPYPPDYKKD